MEKELRYTIERLPKSEIKLIIKTNPEEFKDSMDKAFLKLASKTDIKGFRKGKAPKNLIVEALGSSLTDEALNHLLINTTELALKKENIAPINSPTFNIIKFNPEEEIEFSVSFATYPTVEIGDLKKIKIKKEDMENAKKTKAEMEKNKDKVEDNDKKETTDEPIKEDKFNIDEYYSKIMDDIMNICKFEIPDSLAQSELDYQEKNFENRLSQLGIKVEDYLKLQNTTMDKMRETWKKSVDFNVKQDLLLTQYSKDSKIEVDEKELETLLKQMYKEEEISKINESTRNYIRFNFLKQKSFIALIKFIESNNE